ncbi:pathogenicity-like protein [Arenimonas sp. MALMAid1274]|uniref:pathogenicity-like protein n=1 Tax=Arenimonas sp. MALMAid1274 TaxID=3411630 RepID=UPI003BA1EF46
MRQVFTSVRLENVENVQRMLDEAGIATKITGGRSWKGVSRREFSYSNKNHDPSQQPALWVLKPDDFKQAREILHAAGLLEATRDSSYLPEALQFREPPPAGPMARMARMRMVLLGLVALGAAIMMARVFLA